MDPEKTSQETIRQAIEKLRQRPSEPLDVLINGMQIRITVLGVTGDTKGELTPQELSSFIKESGPVFEDEEERIEALIRKGREQTLLREPPVL